MPLFLQSNTTGGQIPQVVNTTGQSNTTVKPLFWDRLAQRPAMAEAFLKWGAQNQ